MFKSIKRIIRDQMTPSIGKENEFDQSVYDHEQFKHRDSNIYEKYAMVIFDIFKPLDFIDIGCANGFISNFLQSKGVDAYGIEGADAAFDFMPNDIKSKVYKLDLRYSWDDIFYKDIKRKFEVVNFTEVAEHLKPEHEDIMINNIKMLVGKFLIMSWSDQWCPFKGTEKQEHFNPRSKKYVLNKMSSFGFEYQKLLSDKFNNIIYRLEVYEHWKNSILVFKL
ncbi:hypothetical protein [Campylobacter curvus]|uniref:hypothetical protein n=1 Tax=Campylobacter curvus TaxID=200 RepID=UPI0014704AD3|nr:hypothetical protein [Campylobacter curvus]